MKFLCLLTLVLAGCANTGGSNWVPNDPWNGTTAPAYGMHISQNRAVVRIPFGGAVAAPKDEATQLIVTPDGRTLLIR